MTPIDKQALFLLYDAPDNTAQVQVVVKDETIWMTQKAMAELFDVNVPAISKYLKNIFESGELDEQVAVSKMEITTQHGAISGKTQTIETQFYSLDAIISVGYRVNSTRATRFRQWATKILNEKAEAEYDIYNRTQPIESDFDREIKKMIKQEGSSL